MGEKEKSQTPVERDILVQWVRIRCLSYYKYRQTQADGCQDGWAVERWIGQLAVSVGRTDRWADRIGWMAG